MAKFHGHVTFAIYSHGSFLFCTVLHRLIVLETSEIVGL